MTKPPLLIIKIGGNIIDDERALNSFFDDFAALPQHKILVHGGGKLATELSKKEKHVQSDQCIGNQWNSSSS